MQAIKSLFLLILLTSTYFESEMFSSILLKLVADFIINIFLVLFDAGFISKLPIPLFTYSLDSVLK